MVQLINSSNIRPDSIAPCLGKLPVKLEIEDPLDDVHGPLEKKPKISAPLQQQRSRGNNNTPHPANYNPLDEPSPLGLRLRKSPSLLDLIQMRLSQGNAAAVRVTNSENLDQMKEGDVRCSNIPATSDKLKASNFPASLLRIGTWECVSRYEGDLVAKCYFAKHKLVWEVLDGSLKSKIEIQWSDITAMKASCPDNGPGTLDIVLARQPLFFRETNPQPRKHTLWQATSDFTGGQASIHRRHFLQCPQGLLNKHVEKLIQCDPHLNLLSRQPDIKLESPYFEFKASVFDEQDDSKCHGFDYLKSDYVAAFSAFRDGSSPCEAQSSSSISEVQESASQVPEKVSRGTPSPSSVMDMRAIEENGTSETEDLKEPSPWDRFKVPGIHPSMSMSDMVTIEENGTSETEDLKEPSPWDQFKVPGIHPSMSMSDMVTHIEHCISEQMSAGKSHFSVEGPWSRNLLDEITQYLLSDFQFSAASDEQSLMSRVNSFCCLLQKDTAGVQSVPVKTEDSSGAEVSRKPELKRGNKGFGDFQSTEGESNDAAGCKTPAMSGKDSGEDLLLHLPRIASLPQFLFNISEDTDNQAR